MTAAASPELAARRIEHDATSSTSAATRLTLFHDPAHLSVEHAGGAIVVDGDVDMATAQELAAALAPWLLPGAEVRVNVAGVSFLGSSGMRVLHQAAAGLGATGRLVLVAPSPAVRRALDVFGASFDARHGASSADGEPQRTNICQRAGAAA